MDSSSNRKPRSRNVAKGYKGTDGSYRLREWGLTIEQGELLELYNLNLVTPSLGPSFAHGLLNIGGLELSTDGNLTRRPMPSVFTRVNIADHFRLFDHVWEFFGDVDKQGISIPNTVMVGAQEQVLSNLDEQIVFGLRKHLKEKGFEGVKCWFYVCPTIEAFADGKGNIGFTYGKEAPLTIVPRDPAEAVKKWQLSADHMTELSLTAGWLAYSKLPAYNMFLSEKQMAKLFGGWREFLPEPRLEIVDYLKRNALSKRNGFTE